jgi:hypothetical protein
MSTGSAWRPTKDICDVCRVGWIKERVYLTDYAQGRDPARKALERACGNPECQRTPEVIQVG